MTMPDMLAEQFELLADAPNGVEKLRELVLQLAVRGKLVEQDPTDEPTAALMEKIAHRRVELYAKGVIKKPAAVPPIAPGDTNALPAGWAIARLGACIELISGQHLKPDAYNTDGIGHPYLTGPADFGDKHPTATRWTHEDRALARRGDILITVKGAGIGKTNILETPTAFVSRQLMAVRPILLDRDFVHLSLLSTYERFQSQGVGIAIPGIGRDEIRNHIIPLPPLAEQKRIVVRVDALMALCDDLEERQRKRGEVRVAACTAAHAALTSAETTKDFARHWTRIENHFDALHNTPQTVQQLRQTILQLAVQGKLVKQDPNDEPAESILGLIEETRMRKYEAKEIPKPKPLPPLDAADFPFPIPKAWKWTTLGKLCYQVSDGPHHSPSYVSKEGGVPFLSTRNVRVDSFDLSTLKYVSPEDHADFCKRTRPEINDILYTKGGTTGIARVNDLDFEFSVWVHVAVLKIAKECLFPKYVAMALNSPVCYEQSQKYTHGSSNSDLGLTRMIKILIPLPPLAEQKRIVAKVDALMALCDDLEAKLAQAEADSRQLTTAIVHHLLDASA